MASISLQVLQGADRGKLFRNLETPVTIGREEGNSVQLNDERISRFHAKIQEDKLQLVLTDLDSTNGTQVNGQDCQLRVLRTGDLIGCGRSVLLVGVGNDLNEEPITSGVDQEDRSDFDLGTISARAQEQLAARNAFMLPSDLSPAQTAQLVEFLENVGDQLAGVLTSVHNTEQSDTVQLSLPQWRQLLDLAGRVARLARRASDPNGSI